MNRVVVSLLLAFCIGCGSSSEPGPAADGGHDASDKSLLRVVNQSYMPIANVLIGPKGSTGGVDLLTGLDVVAAFGESTLSIGQFGERSITLEGVYEDSFGNRDRLTIPAVLLKAGETTTVTVSCNFTDASLADTVGPVASLRTPAPGILGVERTVVVHATFDEYLDPKSVTAATFLLLDAQGGQVSGTLSYADELQWNFISHALTFTPSLPLASGERYRAVFTSGIKDLAGNPMVEAEASFVTTVEEKWRKTVGKWWYATPAVGPDRIYVGAQAGLHALDLEGTQQWVGAVGETWAVALAEDGTVYAGRYALDPAGAELRLLESLGRGFALGADGAIYTDYGGKLQAYAPGATTPRWEYSVDGAWIQTLSSGWAIDAAGNLLAPWSDGTLRAVSPEGALVWKLEAPESAAFFGAVIGADGTAFCACSDGVLYAVAADSAHTVTPLQVGQKITGMPVIDAEGFLYVPALDGAEENSSLHFFHKVSPAGAIVWSTERDQLSSSVRTSPVIDADGTVYVVAKDSMSDDVRILGLTAAGETAFFAEAVFKSIASPMIAPDGSLLVWGEEGSGDGILVAYDTGSSGLGGGWPCLQANGAHSGRR